LNVIQDLLLQTQEFQSVAVCVGLDLTIEHIIDILGISLKRLLFIVGPGFQIVQVGINVVPQVCESGGQSVVGITNTIACGSNLIFVIIKGQSPVIP
jgi:hypothetical protein